MDFMQIRRKSTQKRSFLSEEMFEESYLTDKKQSQVCRFYANKNVLLTGATGFLGKVILWRLLEACKDIGKIYLMIRVKKGRTVEERLQQLFSKEPFDGSFSQELLKQKVVAVKCDSSKTDLGLDEFGRKQLEDNINVIIHNGASTNMRVENQTNMKVNYNWTKAMLDLYDSLHNPISFVLVSTCFAHWNFKHQEEAMMPLDDNYKKVWLKFESYMKEPSENGLKELLGDRPNTYSMSKAISEHLVADRTTSSCRTAIIRPPLILNGLKHPTVGWINDDNTSAGVLCLIALGITRCNKLTSKAMINIVPVDYVANCIICSAYQLTQEKAGETIVYNMTGGQRCAISAEKVHKMIYQLALEKPSTIAARPLVDVSPTSNDSSILYYITHYISETSFAYLVDAVQLLRGKGRFLVKVTKLMQEAYGLHIYNIHDKRTFATDNVNKMIDSLSQADRRVFPFDTKDFDINTYIPNVYLGIRQFILGDENTEESFAWGRKRYRFIKVIHYILCMTFFGSLFGLSLTTFRLLSYLMPSLL